MEEEEVERKLTPFSIKGYPRLHDYQTNDSAYFLELHLPEDDISPQHFYTYPKPFSEGSNSLGCFTMSTQWKAGAQATRWKSPWSGGHVGWGQRKRAKPLIPHINDGDQIHITKPALLKGQKGVASIIQRIFYFSLPMLTDPEAANLEMWLEEMPFTASQFPVKPFLQLPLNECSLFPFALFLIRTLNQLGVKSV